MPDWIKMPDCEYKELDCPHMGSMGICLKAFAGDPPCPHEVDEDEPN